MSDPFDGDAKEKTLIDVILEYVALLLQYKKMIISLTILSSILAVGFSILSLRIPAEKSPLPNIYRAYAIVLFQEGISNTGMSSMLSAFGIESGGSGASSTQLAIQVLKSRSFIDAVVEEFDLIELFEIRENPKSTSRRMILNNSQYSYNRDSGTLTISYSHIDPVFAADLVNYKVELLEKWFLEQGVTLRSKEMTLMEEKLNELTEEIRGIEKQIESFQKEHGVLDIMELAASQSTMLTNLRTMLNQVELEINDYSEYSTIDDPSLLILKNRRSNIISQIERIEGGYISMDGRKMPSIEEMPQISLNFSHLQSELALKNQLFMTLSERFEVTKLAVAEEGVFSVLEFAEVPEEKIGPSRGRLSISVTAGTFIASIFLALLINLIRGVLSDPEKKRIFEKPIN